MESTPYRGGGGVILNINGAESSYFIHFSSVLYFLKLYFLYVKAGYQDFWDAYMGHGWKKVGKHSFIDTNKKIYYFISSVMFL